MNAAEQTAIVLYTMRSLKAEGSWCGETHIQKTLYLCQEVGHVPSKFTFVLYKFGPFSFELSEHLQGLIADDLVQLLTRPPYGPTLAVSDDPRSHANEFEVAGSAATTIEFMAKKVGHKGVADLEKLATAVFVNRKCGTNTPIEKRAKTLHALKAHVPIDAARRAFVEADALEEEARGVAV